MLDVVIALVLLVVGAPVIAVVALLVRLQMGAPVLFRQERAGRDGRSFWLVKFRSMRNGKPGEDGPESDAARLTKLGKFIRATSIDELPSMMNVLRGHMSLVGPRPLPVRYLPRYSPEHFRRHEVRPGITGWAQVNGYRGETGTVEKMQRRVECDLDYLRNWSLRLDLTILVRTALLVWRDRNAY